MVDNILTLVCVSENSGAEISHLIASSSAQDPFVPILPFGDIQHSEHPLISSSALTAIRTSLPDNHPGVLHPQISSSRTDTNFYSYPVHLNRSTSMSIPVHLDATLPPQAQAASSAASYSLLPPSDSIHNLPSSLRVTSSDAHHACYTPPDAHYHIRPSRDFLGLQHQHILLPIVPRSLCFNDASIPESSLLNSPFACGAFLPRVPLSQTDTNVCSQNPSSFDVDPARSIHQNMTATLYPQAQVTHFAAYRPWQPPNNYSQVSPSFPLRATFSNAHHVLQPFGCYTQYPRPPSMLVPPPSVFLPSHPHNFVEQNLPTSQARFAGFESAHHEQLYPSNNHTVVCDSQGASFTLFHPPSTVSGVSDPMPRSAQSGSFPKFPPARSDCRNPNLPFHDVASREICYIPAPTQTDANRSSTLRVQSHDTSSGSRHPTMQPTEAKRRRTTGEIFGRTSFV